MNFSFDLTRNVFVFYKGNHKRVSFTLFNVGYRPKLEAYLIILISCPTSYDNQQENRQFRIKYVGKLNEIKKLRSSLSYWYIIIW